MKSATLTLPDGRILNYHIRPSTRAKYMRMQFSVDKGLIVTQPKGISILRLTEWVHSKLDWISKVSLDVAAKREQLTPTEPLQRPDSLELTAINQNIRVQYILTKSRQIRMEHNKNGVLTLEGATDNTEHCILSLQKWTQNYAKQPLGLALQKESQRTGLSYESYRVKAQRSRWGSCSSRGNINLNYKLILMPTEWMRYTLIHELCHTQEMNHSKRFWALVEQHMPDYQRIHNEMKRADTVLPDWANYKL
uniref:YgjP-like metallopeptidase domain-containing protein n=1 Tax=uncultured Thiotrichaceae bacterium TaxID=298394 RepID=A0A6S6SE74_9GAMM|nr:MAG: protein of unknown function DUF45 [uncultured Thiotrichaceae bacterium]